MTSPGGSRPLRLLALAVALVVLGAACGGLAERDAQSKLAKAIRGGEAYNVRVNVHIADGEAQVRIRANKDLIDTEESATTETARITWETFPYRFDSVRITMDSNDPTTLTRAQLQARFGARSASLDRKALRGEAATGAAGVIALLAGGVLCVGLVVLLVVLLTRSGRNRRTPPTNGPVGGWPSGPEPLPYAYPPASYPPPGTYPPPGSRASREQIRCPVVDTCDAATAAAVLTLPLNWTTTPSPKRSSPSRGAGVERPHRS